MDMDMDLYCLTLFCASEASEAKPEGMGPYLRNLFEGKQCR